MTGTYTGGVYTYTNKTKKININVKVGTEERQLKLSGKVSSEADAKARLIAKLKNANHGATTISFTIPGYPGGSIGAVHQRGGLRENGREILH